MSDVRGKKVLVTGGSRGIGRAIVEAFAKAGADVLFTYHSNEQAANEVIAACAETGSTIISLQADAADHAGAESAVTAAVEKFGRLDVLVNNAGITKDTLLLRMTEENFDSVIHANLKSVFNYTKAAIKPMMSQRYGRIINISSVVALTGNAGQANYTASKAGVIGFSKSTAKELGSRNITVNVVAPGFIETDMTAKLNEKQREAILAQIPLKKTGTGADIAAAVLFFASDPAAYITGQVLCVDGGMAM